VLDQDPDSFLLLSEYRQVQSCEAVFGNLIRSTGVAVKKRSETVDPPESGSVKNRELHIGAEQRAGSVRVSYVQGPKRLTQQDKRNDHSQSDRSDGAADVNGSPTTR